MNRSTLRFFWIVQGPGAGSVGAAALLLMFATYLAWQDPAAIEQVFAIALFLQMFSAATGYRGRMRRGHFDPVLAGRANRWRLALAHWMTSAALGLLTWLALGLLALIADASHWPTPFTPAGIVVLVYVSTVAWATTIGLPRYSGAVLWLALLFGLAATQHLQALRVAFNPGATTGGDVLRSVGDALVLPIFLLLDEAAVSGQILCVMLLATLAVWMAGAAVICRLDACLVDT